MNRTEAIALLQELVKHNIIHPIFLSLEKNMAAGYDVVINQDLDDCDIMSIKNIIIRKPLVLFEDSSRGCYRIRILTSIESLGNRRQ
jgi:hypothetical protein